MLCKETSSPLSPCRIPWRGIVVVGGCWRNGGACGIGRRADISFSARADDRFAKRHRRRRWSWTEGAPELQRYQNATHWPSGNALPPCVATDAQKRRRYPDWREPSDIAGNGLRFYIGAVLCLGAYGWIKPLRDPCWGLPTPVMVITLAFVFCLPNAMHWLRIWVKYSRDETDLVEHVRVLYLLLFLDRADVEQAQVVLCTIKRIQREAGDIVLYGAPLPDLPSTS